MARRTVELWAWGPCEAIGRAGDGPVAAVGPVPVVIGMVLVCGLAEGLLGRWPRWLRRS